ncbi:MAG: hypothetical protein HXO02_09555 [Prevotella salivae]|nr:hypothetical protein [Segatella salivae]
MGAKDVCRIDEPHRGSAFDSPGLPNDSAGYPGLIRSVGYNAIGVALLYFYLLSNGRVGAKDVCRIDEPHRGSAFDSPGLPNDSAGYPGLIRSVGYNAIGVALL